MSATEVVPEKEGKASAKSLLRNISHSIHKATSKIHHPRPAEASRDGSLPDPQSSSPSVTSSTSSPNVVVASSWRRKTFSEAIGPPLKGNGVPSGLPLEAASAVAPPATATSSSGSLTGGGESVSPSSSFSSSPPSGSPSSSALHKLQRGESPPCAPDPRTKPTPRPQGSRIAARQVTGIHKGSAPRLEDASRFVAALTDGSASIISLEGAWPVSFGVQKASTVLDLQNVFGQKKARGKSSVLRASVYGVANLFGRNPTKTARHNTPEHRGTSPEGRARSPPRERPAQPVDEPDREEQVEFESNPLVPILAVLQGPFSEVHLAALSDLNGLMSHLSIRDRLVQSEIPKVLIHLLIETEDERAFDPILLIFYSLSLRVGNRRPLIELDLLQTLISLAEGVTLSSQQQELALKICCNILVNSSIETTANFVSNSEVLPSCLLERVLSLADPSRGPQWVNLAFALIRNMIFSPIFFKQFLSDKCAGIPKILDFVGDLSSPPASAFQPLSLLSLICRCTAACDAGESFATRLSPDYSPFLTRICALDEGFFEPLLQQLARLLPAAIAEPLSVEAICLTIIADVLCSLSMSHVYTTDPSLRALLTRSVCSALEQALKAGSAITEPLHTTLHSKLMIALGNLCHESTASTALVFSTAVVPLLIGHPSKGAFLTELVKEICRLLTIISFSAEGAQILIEQGIFSVLTVWLSDNDADVRKSCSEAHANLARHSGMSSQVSSSSELSTDDIVAARKPILVEVLETERTYVEVLLTLATHFRYPMMNENVLSEEDATVIFSNSEQLCTLHTDFLMKLQRRLMSLQNDENIGDLFIELAQKLPLYKAYINGYSDSSKALAQAIQRESFRKFLDDQTRILKMKTLGLSSCLITPIQRLPRYNLLLASLLSVTPPSHPDHMNLSTALLELQAIGDFLDSENRKLETLRTFANIVSDFPLYSPSRILLDCQKLSKFDDDAQGRSCQVLLFNDIVVYCVSLDKNIKDREAEGFETKMALSSWFPLSQLAIVDAGILQDGSRRCHSVQLSYFEQQLLLFGSPIAKKRLIKNIQTAQKADAIHWRNDNTMRPVKVFIPPNEELRPLGLNSTHRTLQISVNTPARDTRKQMITRMCKAMSNIQIQQVAQECVDHRLYIRDTAAEDSTERVVALEECPLRYLLCNSAAQLLFKPYPPRQYGFDASSATVDTHIEDDDQAAIEEKGFLRIHLPDNIFLRQLGFENTFKTLVADNSKTAGELEIFMKDKMSKGMTEQQKATIENQCSSYHLHMVSADSRIKRRLNPLDKPLRMHKTLVAREGARGWRLFFLPVGAPHFQVTNPKLAPASSTEDLDPENLIGSRSSSGSGAPEIPILTTTLTNSTTAMTTPTSTHAPLSATSIPTATPTGTAVAPGSPRRVLPQGRKPTNRQFNREAMPPPPLPPPTNADPLEITGSPTTPSSGAVDGAAALTPRAADVPPASGPSMEAEDPPFSAPLDQIQEDMFFDGPALSPLPISGIAVHVRLTPKWILEMRCDPDSSIQVARAMLIAKLSSYTDQDLKQKLGLTLGEVTPHFVDSCGAELFDEDCLSDVYVSPEILDVAWY